METAQHPVTAKAYVATWLALLALTAVTFWQSFQPGGRAVHLTLALLIATVKGTLVALYFMHLLESRSANRVVFLFGVLFVALIVTLTAADVLTR